MYIPPRKTSAPNSLSLSLYLSLLSSLQCACLEGKPTFVFTGVNGAFCVIGLFLQSVPDKLKPSSESNMCLLQASYNQAHHRWDCKLDQLEMPYALCPTPILSFVYILFRQTNNFMSSYATSFSMNPRLGVTAGLAARRYTKASFRVKSAKRTM